MKVLNDIIVSRPQDIGWVSETSMLDSLGQTCEEATSIDIISAYYSESQIIELLRKVSMSRRGKCKIRMAFNGQCGQAYITQQEELSNLKARIGDFKFKRQNVSIFLMSNVPLFHTKLIKVVKATQPIFFVGSANLSASMDRRSHDILVKLQGRHEELSNYVEQVFKCDNAVSILLNNSLYPTDITSFVRSGSVAWKLLRSNNYSIDLLRLKPEERDELSAALAKEKIRYSELNSGFRFNFLAALDFYSRDEAGQNASSGVQVQIKPYAVETCYGYWIPPVFKYKVDNNRDHSLKKKFDRLLKIRDHINESDTKKKVFSRAEEYVEDIKKLVPGIFGAIDRKTDVIRDRFDCSFQKLAKKLDSDDELKRLSQVINIAPVPEIWADDRSASNFMDSFFSDIYFRLDRASDSGRSDAIIKRFSSMLHGATPDDQDHLKRLIEEAISEKRLGEFIEDGEVWEFQRV